MKSITYDVTVNPYNTFWKLNDQLHREDGPAIQYANGNKSWYINGKQVTEEEHQRRTQPAVEMTIEEIEKLLGHRIKVVK